MTLLDAALLFIAMATLALLPSSSVALVVSRASTNGFLNGAAVALGIVLADLVFVCLAILGMAALAETMGTFFMVVRYLAAAYLIWLGISLLLSRPSAQSHQPEQKVSTLSVSFLSGFMLTLGDVKAIVFYASLFPLFVDLANIQLWDIALIVVITLFAVGGVKLVYAYVAGRVVSMSPGVRVERGIRLTAGSFMLGAGAFLAFKP